MLTESGLEGVEDYESCDDDHSIDGDDKTEGKALGDEVGITALLEEAIPGDIYMDIEKNLLQNEYGTGDDFGPDELKPTENTITWSINI